MLNSYKTDRRSWFLLVIFLLATSAAPAQQTQATISGTVRDESSGVVPGATVTITHVETGISRTVISDEAGRYAAPQLSLGEYRVQAELQGFQAVVHTGIRLTMGREAVIDLTLKVGEITNKIEVTGEAPLVERTTATLSGLVDEKQVKELPLNGRDYMQLARNQQGVQWYRSSVSSQTTGIGVRISVGGGRDNQNAFLMDGTDINDSSNSTPGGAGGSSLGVETIREFQILTNAYSAEFGRNSGGVINIVTRAGTNEFHGTLYEFLRNSSLDAKNFFDPLNTKIPAYKRNQFGAMVTGPIRQEKTFFMANYEGLRERLGLSRVVRVPGANARLGRLPSGQVPVSDLVKPFLALLPLPNGQSFSDGTGEYLSSPTQPLNQYLLVGRIDHRLSDKDTLFGRYTRDISDRTTPDGHGLLNSDFVVRNQYVTLEEQHVVSPRLLNTVRFGFSRSLSSAFNENIGTIDPSLASIPGGLIAAISVSGITGFGTNSLIPRTFVTNTFDIQHHMNWSVGRHAIKFGENAKRFQDNDVYSRSRNGNFTFLSLADFLQDKASTVEIEAPGTDDIRGVRQSLYGFYVQDDFKPTSRLSVNMGLRYEFITVPWEVNGKSANVRKVLDPTWTIGPIFANPSLKNFGPRLGIAWDPFGNGKTSVRLGAGIFYDQCVSAYTTQIISLSPPFFINANIANPPFPNVLPAIGKASGAIRVLATDYNLGNPRRAQYNLSIQRELTAGLVFNAGYVGSQSRQQLNLIDEANTAYGTYLPDGRKFFNQSPAPRLPRRNPNFQNINFRATGGNSSFNSMQLGLNKRYSSGALLQFSYTYSKNLSFGDILRAATSDNNGDNIVDPDRWDRGPSEFDIRHNVVVNYVLELPFGPGKRWRTNMSGVEAAVLGGWQLSSLASFASGPPFGVNLGFDRARAQVRSGGGGQRPDLKPGSSSNPVLGGPNQYFDPSSFLLPPEGYLGTLGRNTLVGPGLTNFDFSLSKRLTMGEKRTLSFRAEFFNLFNHANYDVPSSVTVFLSTGPASGVGRITRTITTSRQVQFGLKFVF